jgi:hypothetical protein
MAVRPGSTSRYRTAAAPSRPTAPQRPDRVARGQRLPSSTVWLEIVQIALDLLAWMPMLALTGKARLWEPRRLRLRLFCAAGQLVTTGRRRILRLAHHWPWARDITDALARLALLPNPG